MTSAVDLACALAGCGSITPYERITHCEVSCRIDRKFSWSTRKTKAQECHDCFKCWVCQTWAANRCTLPNAMLGTSTAKWSSDVYGSSVVSRRRPKFPRRVSMKLRFQAHSAPLWPNGRVLLAHTKDNIIPTFVVYCRARLGCSNIDTFAHGRTFSVPAGGTSLTRC